MPNFDKEDTPDRTGSPASYVSSFQTPDGLSDGPVENEPIAIIGIGCRLPGGVRSPNDLWELLAAQKSGQGDVPPSRFNIDGFYHPNGNERPGSVNMRGGYFLQENIRAFENSFFGINNLEATYMDPQQRKLLEVVYEALESAGVTLEQVSGANIGTYVGSFAMDFWTMQARDSEYFHRLSATGMGTTILANRISHTLNLCGPSFVLDTACSSSLYGLHLACAALDAGECDAAIVAAANLVQSPEQHLGTMKAGVLSPTSTCHTFDASADGYGRGEGVGALFIKKLSKAIANGDPVRATIRGTAVNSNGRTPGITLPSAVGQEAVIRKAYEKAGLHDFLQTGYVECHGTGTPVGDPIEVEAVSRVFGKHRAERGLAPLHIGSVKPNLGHSEAASGISSIIKTCLALDKGIIPPTYGVKKLNPKIKDQEWGVHIVTKEERFPIQSADGRQFRRAGVNSFGYGGANSHAILESPATYVPRPDKEMAEGLSLGRSKFLIPLSASNPVTIEAQAAALAASPVEYFLVDLAHTLGVRRSRLHHRGFALAGQLTHKEDLQPDKFQTTATGTFSKLPLAFVFTGQGAQWPLMGKELVDEFPSFRRTIDELDGVLQSLPEAPGWTLRGVLTDGAHPDKINHVSRSQPVCTAIQIAYVDLLARWGIQPEGVVGHSSGEIGAAYAAGLLTAAQAIIVAYYRGHTISNSTNPVPGAMMAAGLGREAANAEIEALGLKGSIKVACVNSPESVTISGDAAGIDVLLKHLEAGKIFARKLKTDGRAYHSHHMSLIGNEYQQFLEERLAGLPTASSSRPVRWISSVHNKSMLSQTVSPAYWRHNLERPVLFSGAVEGLLKDNKYHLVEIGPHSALELPIKQIRAKMGLEDGDIHYSNALTRGKNAVDCVLNLMGRLFLHGHDVDFAAVNYVETEQDAADSEPEFSLASPWKKKPQGRVIPDLPPYPWTYDDSELWYEGRQSHEFRNRKHVHHDLIGAEVPGGNGVISTWRNKLRISDIPWVEGHKLGQAVVLPGAAYMAMAIEAVCQVTSTTKKDKPTVTLRDVHILKALELSTEPNDAGVETFTTIHRDSDNGKWFNFEISTHSGSSAAVHATGRVRIDNESGNLAPIHREITPEGIRGQLEEVAIRNWYDRFSKVGLNFGEGTFRTIRKVATHRKKEHTYAQSKVPYYSGGRQGSLDGQSEGRLESDYIMHPRTIDAMLQTGLIASSAGVLRQLECKVPTVIAEARFRAPVASEEEWLIDARSQKLGLGAIQVAAELHDGNGQVCAQLQDVNLVVFQGGATVDEAEDERHPMLRVVWKPDAGKLHGSAELSEYITSFVNARKEEDVDVGVTDSVKKLAAVVDLVVHKNPTLNVLDLSGSNQKEVAKYLFDKILRMETAFQRCVSYTIGWGLSDKGELLATEVKTADSFKDASAEMATAAPKDKKYGLIIVPDPQHGQDYLVNHPDFVQNLIQPGGAVVALLPSSSTPPIFSTSSEVAALEVSLAAHEKLLLQQWKAKGSHKDDNWKGPASILVVERSADKAFNDEMVTTLKAAFASAAINRVSLQDLRAESFTPVPTITISTVELHNPILSTLTPDEMASIKHMTDHASNLIWLTGGDLMSGERPEYALVSGLSRALMLEQPSLRFFVYDVDKPTVASAETTARGLVYVIQDAMSFENPDYELVERRGTVHVSRLVPDEDLNSTFRVKQDDVVGDVRLADLGRGSRLTIKDLGNFDSLAWRQPEDVQVQGTEADLPDGYVEVQIKAIGLNQPDILTYAGKFETRDGTTSSECAGIVIRVGGDVTNLKPGDRVVVMAPGHFATLEAFPAWACGKLVDNEAYDQMASLPTAFAIALYCLQRRANIREKESVLVHAGGSSLGVAAIQVAQLSNAEIFATVNNNAERHYLIVALGIQPEKIFGPGDPSVLPSIMAATGGRGVDVVLNTLGGDLLQDGWRACARFGRFVDVGGGHDSAAAGKLDMDVFKRNVTFSTFNLEDLYDKETASEWQDLFHESLTLYREGKISGLAPLKVFDAGEVSQAFRYGSTRPYNGKIVISLDKHNSLVKALPSKYDTRFSPDKTYLMIGCLGGLGRSMSKWMIKRGARKFVFLGRSGIDKPAAANLVDDLRESGATVMVVRGDVSNFDHVKQCVDVVEGDIGGVVQAAMGLSEALWTTMPSKFWHNGIDPKLIGSFNLHNAIKGKDSALDFFLMTSSVSGSVGTATESNYCAANYFLDVFARYRRSQGLPATSLGLGMISEVGYLHENPEIEALLLRKGIQAINERELLHIVDIALSSSQSKKANDSLSTDRLAASHILTGLEPLGLKELRKRGFEGTNLTLNDARALLLSSALDRQSSSSSSTAGSGAGGGVLEEIMAAISLRGDDALRLIVASITKRFSSLIQVADDKIDPTRPITKFGMDSMLAAEFRTWFYQTFKVDVPFLSFLSDTATLKELGQVVHKGLEERSTAA